MDIASLMQAALFALAVLVLAIFAIRIFRQREIEFVGAPAVPHVLTTRSRFLIGAAAYSLSLIVFYAVVTYFWGPFKTAFGPLLTNHLPGVAKVLDLDAANAESILPWVVAAVVGFVFVWNHKHNPFVVVLDFLLDTLQVPSKAVAVYEAFRETTFGMVDADLANRICNDPGILDCEPGYFRMGQRDLERRWAHVCYLHFLLRRQLREPRNRKFYAEKTLRWSDIKASYQARAAEIRSWLAGNRDYRDAAEILLKIAKLKDEHYRMLACIAVATNRSDRELWEWVDTVARTEVRPRPGNLGRYIVFLPVVLFFAILFGRETAIVAYEAVAGNTPELVNFDMTQLVFWAKVSIFVYSLPIVAMFVLRTMLVERFPFEKQRYWLLYGAAFVVGYVITILALPAFRMGYFNPFAQEHWTIADERYLLFAAMPAFVTAFVVYRLDSPAFWNDSPLSVWTDRILAAALCAGVGLLVSVLGVFGLPDKSMDSPATPQGFVIVWTTVVVGLAVGLLSRFETTVPAGRTAPARTVDTGVVPAAAAPAAPPVLAPVAGAQTALTSG
jgi:hypothetical protein